MRNVGLYLPPPCRAKTILQRAMLAQTSASVELMLIDVCLLLKADNGK